MLYETHLYTSRPLSICCTHTRGTKQPACIKSMLFLIEGQLKLSLCVPGVAPQNTEACFSLGASVVSCLRLFQGSEVHPNKFKCVDKPRSPLLSSDLTTSDHSFIPDFIKTRLSAPSSLCSVLRLCFLARREASQMLLLAFEGDGCL